MHSIPTGIPRASAASGGSPTTRSTPSLAHSRGEEAAGAGHAQWRHLGRRLLRRAASGTSTTSSSRSRQLPVEREERGDARRLPQASAGFAGGSRACALADFQRLRAARSVTTKAQPAAGGHRACGLCACASGPLRRRSTSIPTPTSIRSSPNSSGTTTTRERCANSANGSPAADRTRDSRQLGVPDLSAVSTAATAHARRSRIGSRAEQWQAWRDVDPPRTFPRETTGARARSGRTRGCANGRCSAAISSTCTTTSLRDGWRKPEFRANASGHRRG